LRIDIETIKGHLEALFDKLALKNRTEAAVVAVAKDWNDTVGGLLAHHFWGIDSREFKR
jgi:hypothetical protein